VRFPTLSRSEKVTFELSMLRTATLCLIAFGAIMVYSASSGTTFLSEGGDSSYYLKRYVFSAAAGLVVMAIAARASLYPARRLTPVLLACAFGGLLLVLMPGFGVEANGAHRWLGAGPLQVQPSEVAKLALVLYAAAVIAADPARTRSLYGVRQLLLVGGGMAGLVLIEPDLGTAMVISFVLAALLMVGGIQGRHLAFLAAALATLALLAILFEPYRRERLLTFLNPWADTQGSGFQSVQAMIAIGSGGPFGVGLGESVQKLFYLPEAHTDMILAVIGEELGFAGIFGVLFLYGMIAYAGLGASRAATNPSTKLLPAGDDQLLRGARRASADGRAAAVHLIRKQQPGRAAGGDGAADERRPAGREERAQAETAGDGGRALQGFTQASRYKEVHQCRGS
jgi:cell division protein FtsW